MGEGLGVQRHQWVNAAAQFTTALELSGTFCTLFNVGMNAARAIFSAPLRDLGPEELQALQSGPSGNWNEDNGFRGLCYRSKNVWNEELFVPGNVAA